MEIILVGMRFFCNSFAFIAHGSIFCLLISANPYHVLKNLNFAKLESEIARIRDLKLSLQTKILTILLIIFSAMIVAVISINYTNEKKFVETIVRNQAHEAVDQYFDSVNTLMISGAMEQREILRSKTLQRKDIVEARIFRSEAVKQLFGPGLAHESALNDIEKKAIEGIPYEAITHDKDKRILTVITPFRASSNFRGTNCIECHQTKEGEVLGAVKISYSLVNLDRQIYEKAVFSGKIMAALFIGALILIAILLRSLILSPIKYISQLLKDISQNFDLTIRANKIKSKDEIGEMSNSFNIMIGKFHKAMIEVSETSQILIQGSDKVRDLSRLTETNLIEQQDETNKVASAVTELNSTSKNVASNTTDTQSAIENANSETSLGNDKALLAREKIEQLASKIEYVTKQIEDLETQSTRINEVISLINDITLKTKLLSFNASVEASRAGEQGKGFTVVAQEIGNLANETKKSTEQITNITNALLSTIAESVKIMRETRTVAEDGRSFVGDSSRSLEQIAEEVAKVHTMAASISNSSREQSIAADSIDHNLQSIMNLTESSVQSAEEMKKIGDELNAVAAKLNTLIGHFRI